MEINKVEGILYRGLEIGVENIYKFIFFLGEKGRFFIEIKSLKMNVLYDEEFKKNKKNYFYEIDFFRWRRIGVVVKYSCCFYRDIWMFGV